MTFSDIFTVLFPHVLERLAGQEFSVLPVRKATVAIKLRLVKFITIQAAEIQITFEVIENLIEMAV
jgi:hypothetical protein